jgi:hypothetical protein
MPSIFVRFDKEDGRFHYGVTLPAGRARSEPLMEIVVTGSTEYPAFPGESSSATPAQHNAWLAGLRSKGFKVEGRITDNSSQRRHRQRG